MRYFALLAAGIYLLGHTTASSAEEVAESISDSETPVHELDPITVAANKSSRPLSQLAGTVTVLDNEDIEKQSAQDIKDLIRYEPGVSVSDQGSRFGLSGFRIRGIGGNRVLTEVDGVPISDNFSIGSFSNASRDFIDLSTIKQVEIIRGTSSSLFGSDALGGVVAVTTLDPMDYLDRTDKDVYIDGRLGYSTDDDGYWGSSNIATASGKSSFLLNATYRSGHEIETGSNSDRNPHDYDSFSLLGKFVYGFENPLRVTLEYREQDSTTDVDSMETFRDFSAIFGFPYLVNTTLMQADDTTERKRISVDQHIDELGSMWADDIFWRVYTQSSSTVQNTLEERTTTILGNPSPVRRERLFDFDQEILGGEITFAKTYQTDNASHKLIYGIEVESTDIEQLRDGIQTNLLDGSTSKSISPDEFPVRDFPNSKTLEAGFYIQDEISTERLTFIPGLRFDYYDLDPSPDQIFIDDNPGITPSGLSESQVSPRLGLTYKLTDRISLAAQYARGFRAPPFNDVNLGFTNFQFGYTAIPNPDLKPETGDSFELGIRTSSDNALFSLTTYYNEYDDFIESLINTGVNDQGLLVFQSRNIASATIYGVEAKLAYALDRWLEGLQLHAAASWSKGDNDENDQPLNTVDPHKTVIGLAYDNPGNRWGMELIGTFVDRKSRVDESGGALFKPAGYGLVDLLAYWQLNPYARVNLGVFNITDKTYWDWADIAGVSVTSSAIDRLARSGINGRISLTLNF